jgi:hypothetical protein
MSVPILPDYTDEWVAGISEGVLGEVVSTTADFEKGIMEYLVINKLFEESTLDSYDEEAYDAMYADQQDYYEQYATSQGMDLETMLSLYGMTEESMKEENYRYIEMAVNYF